MKKEPTPDRKGSKAAYRAHTDCIILAVLCGVGGVGCLLSDDLSSLAPGLLGALVALLLLSALFRVLGGIAFDLETIASIKTEEYKADDPAGE